MDAYEAFSTSDENDCNLEGLIHDYHDSKNEVIEVSPKGRFLKFNDLIGKSAFKTIHRALDSEMGCEVAWNTISLKNLTNDEISQISQEVKINHQLQHKNIICMNSAWTSKQKEELVIISEIVTGGSLRNYLARLPQPRLKLIKMWCRGILSGLDYLHSQDVPIVHGELTAENIHIMSSDGTVKISDFYLNKFVCFSSSVMGSPEYIAPEVFKGKYSTKADIYSFGMSLLEMCTQSPPYQECSSNSMVYSHIRSKILPESIDKIKDVELVKIIKLCLSDQKRRPTAKELLSYRFLELEESPKNTLKDSICNPSDQSIPTRSTIKKISLIIKDNYESPKEVTFDFNTNEDTPEKVATEMVETLNMDKSSIIKVAKEIEKKLEGIASSESDRNIKIFKFKTDAFEPSTATAVPEEPLPVLRKCLSLDEEAIIISNSNLAIKHLQALLANLFAVKLNSNGFIGKKTAMLIKRFQNQEGLVPNGIIDDQLYELLTHRISQL